MRSQVPSHLLRELLKTAKYASSSLLLSQASGGNNSVKSVEQDLLWVKASGVRLADVTESNGYVAVRLSALNKILQQGSEANSTRREEHEQAVALIQAAALPNSKGRPSLETQFHGLFPQAVALHLHPVFVNAFTCMHGGRGLLADTTRTQFAWAPYASPGTALAKEVANALLAVPAPTLVLENHGFVAAGQTAQEVIQLIEAFIHAGKQTFGELSLELLDELAPSSALVTASERITRDLRKALPNQQYAVRPARYRAFDEFCRNPSMSEAPGPLVPDDVVYTGTGMRLQNLESACESAVSNIPDKMVFALEGIGTVMMARNEQLLQAMEETLLAHVLVRMLIARRGRPRPLPADEIEYLQNMESERYRIALASGVRP
jgi:rhamnose utilization protein RhaD (predicted bifunctional aldolase and dehydrogenase)